MVALAWRPVDALGVPEGFVFGRRTALRLGCCTRCGRDVNPAAWGDLDRAEWEMSAMCPDCFDAVVEPEGDA